jgi:hypothetical protein
MKQIHPTHPGQPHIGYDKTEGERPEFFQGGFGVRNMGDCEVCQFKIALKTLGKIQIILNQQELGGAQGEGPSREDGVPIG